MNTNAIPQSILDQVPIVNLLPESWRLWVIIAVVASPHIGRGYQALANGKGIKGVITGIWMGTNTPKQP